MTLSRMVLGAAAAASLLMPSVATAQLDTALAAGAQYRKGAPYRALFGTDYRTLWTQPITVPFLDLRGYAGGLTQLSRGGGYQTKSLWLRGADGRVYGFRSVDKSLDVPEEIDSTFIADIARDLTSAQHPGAPPVVAALLEAAGVLHTEPALVVLPDDPRLDTVRYLFAGVLGYLELRATAENRFAGAAEIVSSRRLIPRLFAGPANRVDAPAFLTARLMDVFLGDWDRHRGQWTWARLTDDSTRWQPIPEDRDHAFVRFGGAMLAVGRATAAPQLVRFGESYASILGQTWNGRDIDRWFLSGLDRAAWDSVAAWLQSRLTDSVIGAAVRTMHPAWYALDGARLTHTLMVRRDGLRAEAGRYYAQLARDAELHATRAAERVTIERLPQGRLAVRLAPLAPGAAPAYLSRTFVPGETRELRIYLYGGGDQVVVRGDGPDAITVRLVGGGTALPDSLVPAAGATVFDSSRAGGVQLYARPGDSAAAGRVAVDRRAWTPPPVRPDAPPARDWGRRWQPMLWIGFGPDVGVFAGVGELRTAYGFRQVPYASSWRFRGGWATTANTGRLSVDGVIHRENSAVRAELSGLVSGIEVLRWYGRGNATTATQGSPYYRVNEHRYAVSAALVVPALGRGFLSLGPAVVFNDTKLQAGRIIADSLPYGANDFGEAGLRAEWRLDTRDAVAVPRHGATLTLGGAVYPAVWDVARTFGEAHAEITTHLSADRGVLRPTLALRAGAKRVFGRYPYHEAAFIGDAATVRLGRQNRYGGDAAAWGNAEARVRLGRVFVLLPGEVGLLALGDIGRVWVDGERSATWHPAAGGGLWWSFVRPTNLLSLAVASGRERTALYLRAGFAY